jgi:hypothetical protein
LQAADIVVGWTGVTPTEGSVVGAAVGAAVAAAGVDADADADADADGEAVGLLDPQPAMTTATKLATSRRRSIPGTSEADRIEAHWRSRPA